METSSSNSTAGRLGCAAMRVSFLVPAYNEAATIVAVLEKVHGLELEKQIVVVDDGSTDGTAELAEEWRNGPDDVPGLIEAIARGVADVVYGSRVSGGRPQRAYLFWHLLGKRFLSLLANV